MESKQRDYGIDCLRALSMLMVVAIHVFSYGGLKDNYDSMNISAAAFRYIYCLLNCAVNCFALITGYVQINSNHRYFKITSLWVSVFFYSVSIGIVSYILGAINLKTTALLFFPVTTFTYWYFTCYFAVFFFIPFFNYLINNLSRKQSAVLVGSLISLFSILQLFSPVVLARLEDPFLVRKGYSPLWLAALYITGAYLKKYNVLKNIKKRHALITFFCSGLLILLSQGGIVVLSDKIPILAEFNNFGNYNSPFVLLCALSLVSFFTNLNIRSKAFISAVKFISPMVFSVYILHEHPVINKKIIDGNFGWISSYGIFLAIPLYFLSVLGIFIACIIIDYFRILLFNVCRIDKFCVSFTAKIESIIGRIYQRFAGAEE